MKINNLLSWILLSIMAIWMMAISLLSVQNATPVALKFLIWQSVPIPLGFLVSVGLAIGLLMGGGVPGFKKHRR